MGAMALTAILGAGAGAPAILGAGALARRLLLATSAPATDSAHASFFTYLQGCPAYARLTTCPLKTAFAPITGALIRAFGGVTFRIKALHTAMRRTRSSDTFRKFCDGPLACGKCSTPGQCLGVTYHLNIEQRSIVPLWPSLLSFLPASWFR